MNSIWATRIGQETMMAIKDGAHTLRKIHQEMQRANDIAAVQAGLMSKQAYHEHEEKRFKDEYKNP